MTAQTDEQLSVCHLMGAVGRGGRESLLLDIVRSSADEFIHTIVGFRLGDALPAEFENAGATVIGLDFSSRVDLLAYTRLLETVRDLDPDVLHAHGPNAQLPARLLGLGCGIGVISTHHGVSGMFSDRLLQAERWTRFLDTASVAVSAGVRSSYKPCPIRESWRTIHNGIDVASFSKLVAESDGDSVRTEYEISTDATVFLNVGRYVDEKRQEDLIRAMESVTENHPTARLFIIGGRGGGPEDLRALAEDVGVAENVFVPGHVTDIHPYYAACDVFALSSTHEGLPITVLEAMAAERAIVATDIPGVKEAVTDGKTGLLVPPEEPDEFGAAMERLTSEDLRRRLARAGHERVLSEFSIEATTRAYEELYYEAAR